jgi:hypothetical protein
MPFHHMLDTLIFLFYQIIFLPSGHRDGQIFTDKNKTMIDFYRLKIHVTKVTTAPIDVTKVGAKNRVNCPNSNRSLKLTIG